MNLEHLFPRVMKYRAFKLNYALKLNRKLTQNSNHETNIMKRRYTQLLCSKKRKPAFYLNREYSL